MHPMVSAGGANAPALSIGVDDGRQAAKPGDLLNYTVKIQNIGTTGAKGLDVVQTLPTGLKLISASRHGAARAGHVRWRVNLPAGRTDTFGVVGRVGQTPKQLLRLATIACASTAGGIKPIVCAAHSDQLPAGAAAGAYARHTAVGHTGGYVRVIGMTLLLAVIAAIGVRSLLARRRPRRAT